MVPIYRIFRTSVQVMHVRKSHHALAASHRPAKLNSRADSHRSNMAKLATTGIAGSLRRAPKAAENEVNKHDARASVSEWRHRKPRLTRWRVVLTGTAQPYECSPEELVCYGRPRTHDSFLAAGLVDLDSDFDFVSDFFELSELDFSDAFLSAFSPFL